MTPPHGDKKKKKRTLIVIDGDALHEGAHYDFSFLENEKRLEIWFFYKERINHSFRLRRDFSAQNILLPRYEDDLNLYILKRVCYELGRREGRYRKVLLIGSLHPVWEGLVQFLRERGLSCTHILAGDYIVEKEPSAVPDSAKFYATSATAESSHKKSPEPSASRAERPSSAQAPKTARSSSKAGEVPSLSEEEKIKLFKRKGRATDKHIQTYERVIAFLRTLPSGTEITRSDFRRKLKEMGIGPKSNLPGKNLSYFLHRLEKGGFIQIRGNKIITLAAL
ncbi:MAG: hypothetical protein N3E49_07035 [Bacteroidia bacterium]|nr:hypothetical protein [Bacteroidia bacterium]